MKIRKPAALCTYAAYAASSTIVEHMRADWWRCNDDYVDNKHIGLWKMGVDAVFIDVWVWIFFHWQPCQVILYTFSSLDKQLETVKQQKPNQKMSKVKCSRWHIYIGMTQHNKKTPSFDYIIFLLLQISNFCL